MLFKHRPKTEWPDTSKIKDEPTQDFATDIGKLVLDSLRNIYDDLKVLEKIEEVSNLPTASIDNKRKILMVPQAGAKDKIYICRYNSNTSTYSWDEVNFL